MTESNKSRCYGVKPVEPAEAFPQYFKGVDSVYMELLIKGSATAGDNNINGTGLTAGQLYWVDNLLAWNTTSISTYISLWVVDAIYGNCMIDRVINPGVGQVIGIDHGFYIHGGQNLRARFNGCTAGDVLNFHITGYKCVT